MKPVTFLIQDHHSCVGRSWHSKILIEDLGEEEQKLPPGHLERGDTLSCEPEASGSPVLL